MIKKFRKGEKFKKKAPLSKATFIIPYFLAVIIVLLLLVMNTIGLKNQLEENVRLYADDMSAQLANGISAQMKSRQNSIANLADTFSRMPRTLLTEELLERKAEFLELDAIFLIDKDESTLPVGMNGVYPEAIEHVLKKTDMHQNPHIFFSESNEVFYSAPIVWRNGSETSFLVGMRRNESIQKMLQDVDFQDYAMSCIVDGNGKVIVSATEEELFNQVKDIFDAGLNEKDNKVRQKFMEDLDCQRSGVVELEISDGERVILGYDYLKINDWMMLTIFPSNLFGSGTEPYLFWYIIITVVLALVMIIIFGRVTRVYQKSYARIQDMAYKDILTGGKNRIFFQKEAKKLLLESSYTRYTFVYMNVCRFKRFNEKYGSKTGDELLKQIYRVIYSFLQDGELLCRESGDHFHILIKGNDEGSVRERISLLLDMLIDELSNNFVIEKDDFSVGAYIYKPDEDEIDIGILIDRAKRASDDLGSEEIKFFSHEFENRIKREQLIEESFQHAMQYHEFQVYIQPKVSNNKKENGAGEVLVRWQHPQLGFISPAEFIPLLERTRKICDLDFYMFEETCKILKKWISVGNYVPLSVNLSRAHLASKNFDFIARFKAIKEQYQIPNGLLELELTESMMLERREIPQVVKVVDRIRASGFLCSIDDFGFGYSSLSMLKDLNVSTVKLDKQFFQDDSEKSWLVVRQIIKLVHNLGMNVVAEGIEKQEYVEKLWECNCDFIQGYVYSKPMPLTEFEHWMESGRI